MRNTLTIFCLVSLCWLPVRGNERLSISHPLTDEHIESALAIGNDVSAKLSSLSLGAAGTNWSGPRSDSNRAGHFFELSQNRRSRTSGFGVELYTPYTWLTKVARDSAMKGREMMKRHVNAQLMEPVLRVVCYSDVPEQPREGAFGNRVESVSIRTANKNLDDAVTPVRVTRIPDRFMTPSGESVDVGPLVARFALADVLSISSLDKKGEFYVSIVAADGEEKEFKVKSKHFHMLP